MIENVADLKKLIQDLDDDTIVAVDDGGALERLEKYDLVCDSCNVNHFNEEGEENDDRECS